MPSIPISNGYRHELICQMAASLLGNRIIRNEGTSEKTVDVPSDGEILVAIEIADHIIDLVTAHCQ